MFESNAYILQQNESWNNLSPRERESKAQAVQLYNNARFQGKLNKVLASLSGRTRHLLNLHKVEAASRVTGRHYAGIQTVRIDRIRGSEGREEDFDTNFYPLHGRSRGRWMSIARAAMEHKGLPPVELIQIGQDYFVRDGHHRISVAHILGQEAIEAEVTVWQVSRSLPACEPAGATCLAAQAV